MSNESFMTCGLQQSIKTFKFDSNKLMGYFNPLPFLKQCKMQMFGRFKSRFEQQLRELQQDQGSEL